MATSTDSRSVSGPPEARFESMLVPWAELNDVSLFDVKITSAGSGGLGLRATRNLQNVEDTFDKPVLVTVPHSLTLCSESVEEFAKVDGSFRELLDALGRGTSRQSKKRMVMLYLLIQILRNRPDARVPSGPRTPWSDYVKCLPRFVPVPTMWTGEEQSLLAGTSLQQPLEAKLAALKEEFELVESKASCLPSWDEAFTGSGAATLDDWILVDALYRSRVLEIPQYGEALVPCIDMVNHSVPANAYYEVSEDEVALLLNQNESVQAMDEITISYGHKPAAEFLFSYGFIDRHSIKQAMVLTYEPPDEDPLARAKAAAYGRPGTVTLARTDDGTIQWESPFIHFAVLNEEDGLELRVLEGPNGTRNLHTFWQGEDVTNATDTFEALTEGHERKSVFRLRAVVTVLAVIKNQLVSMRLPIPDAPAERAAQGVSYSAWQAAATLTEIETAILQDAEDALETQFTMASRDLYECFGPRELSINAQARGQSPSNDETDYS